MTISSVSGSPLMKLLAMLKTLDSNGDGAISKNEFIAGRPDTLSSDQASTLYDAVAARSPNGSGGAIRTQDFATAFEGLGLEMRATLIQTQGESSSERDIGRMARNLKDAIVAYLKDEKEKEVERTIYEKNSEKKFEDNG